MVERAKQIQSATTTDFRHTRVIRATCVRQQRRHVTAVSDKMREFIRIEAHSHVYCLPLKVGFLFYVTVVY